MKIRHLTQNNEKCPATSYLFINKKLKGSAFPSDPPVTRQWNGTTVYVTDRSEAWEKRNAQYVDELNTGPDAPKAHVVEPLQVFEIYTHHPRDPSCRGWDIRFVRSTRSDIKSYPLFDCIITVDDNYPRQRVDDWSPS